MRKSTGDLCEAPLQNPIREPGGSGSKKVLMIGVRLVGSLALGGPPTKLKQLSIGAAKRSRGRQNTLPKIEDTAQPHNKQTHWNDDGGKIQWLDLLATESTTLTHVSK